MCRFVWRTLPRQNGDKYTCIFQPRRINFYARIKSVPPTGYNPPAQVRQPQGKESHCALVCRVLAMLPPILHQATLCCCYLQTGNSIYTSVYTASVPLKMVHSCLNSKEHWRETNAAKQLCTQPFTLSCWMSLQVWAGRRGKNNNKNLPNLNYFHCYVKYSTTFGKMTNKESKTKK